MSISIPLLHFNDVYRVAPQKLTATGPETIDVTQFAAMLEDIRNGWALDEDGKKSGLCLFSGDVFSPSVESSVTRGSHMVPVMNYIAPDVSLTGNHDFDFGYLHLSKLMKDTTFPWILSNVIDNTTGDIPVGLRPFEIFERLGVKIGVIGLVEKEWIGTVSSWPPNFVYRDMREIGIELSKKLRDRDGDYRCDIIIALTHARIPNDIELAKQLNALSPSAQEDTPIYDTHGVDILLGGHDHLYYVSKGVNFWDGYDLTEDVLGAEQDHGDVLVIKSGTDFRDLSEINLVLESSPPDSIRNKVIKEISGVKHSTKLGSRSSPELTAILKGLLSSVSDALKAPVCITTETIDCRSQYIRTDESATCNWFADIIRHAYDDTLCMKGCGGADGVFVCAGTFRGDSQYGPGKITLGDILEILPFEDPMIVLELDGAAIWDALESSLATWPAQEGRFPTISGFRVSWDSSKPPGQRVLGIWLLTEVEETDTGHGDSGQSTPRLVDDQPIERTTGGRKYTIVTRQYMADGHDGFGALQGYKHLIDDEMGQMYSTIVRRYLMGCHFVNKIARIARHPSTEDLSINTKITVKREQRRRENISIHQDRHREVIHRWKHATHLALHLVRSKTHYQEHMKIPYTEHMSSVDPFDGQKARTGVVSEMHNEIFNEDLIEVTPVKDGRLKDIARN